MECADKQRLKFVVATSILAFFIVAEHTGLVPTENERLFRLLVGAAIVAIFGDELAKARDIVAK